MFIYNSNDSDKSRFAKVIKVLMLALTVWQLSVQVYTLLAFTRTKIGSRIRKGFLNTAIDYAEESIEVVGERADGIIQKFGEYEEKFNKAMADDKDKAAENAEEE